RLARRARGLGARRILLLRVDPLGASAALVHALLGQEGAAGEVEVVFTTLRTPAGWRAASALEP
ncbi:MAG: hypothetical protein JSR54_15315, partial [Proteobacteria bacterium]|nr:hypothetical protein [Pseudomonadota bacterium]